MTIKFADVIFLYIHCDDEKHLPQKQQVQAISNILAQNKKTGFSRP